MRCASKTCPRALDMRTIVRQRVITRVITEFKNGLSVRILAQRYGLNADGVQGLIRSAMRG